MPKYVWVEALLAPGEYMVGTEYGEYIYHGNAEQVHSWLGQNGYVKGGDTEDITGCYKRAAVSAVS